MATVTIKSSNRQFKYTVHHPQNWREQKIFLALSLKSLYFIESTEKHNMGANVN